MDPLADADTSESSYVTRYAPSRPRSAIATFSDLISLANSSQTSTESRPVTTLAVRTIPKHKSLSVGLGYLPTEILLSIFHFVFVTCINWDKTGTFYPKHTIVWLEDDPLSPSLFPYSLASVCVRWLHILSSVAPYWTRQVISVGPCETSLIASQTLLRLARNLPFQLILTRHPGISRGTSKDEYTRVRAVLDLLQPHIHQTWSITFDVRYRSSLPALWRTQGDAQRCRVLSLMSTSGVSNLPRTREPHPAGNSNRHGTSPQARFLEDVTLAGFFFNQLNPWSCNVTSLVIRGGSGVSLHRFMMAVQACGLLQKLTVDDVFFVNDVHPSHMFCLNAPLVCLRRITGADAVGSIISQALGTCPKEAISISDCPFDGLGKRSSFRPNISSMDLFLEGIDASVAAVQQLVCFWNGENLSLVNCSGVSASFLRGVPTEETPPDLCRLRIVDCAHASAEGLITLAKTREIQSAIDALGLGDPDGGSCVPLVELHVHGRGPAINAKQAAWFAQHLDTFSWDTVASDGTQYTWDTYAQQLIVLGKRD